MAAAAISFPDPQVQDHLLGQRALLVGSYRVLAHSGLILRSLHRSRTVGRSAALAAASLAVDVGLTVLLSRSTREYFVVRLAHDVLEARWWAGTADGNPILTEGANFLGVGSSVESGYRAGRHSGRLRPADLRCLLPTLVTTAVIAHARRSAGGKPGYGYAGWPLAAALAGFALGRNQRASERRLVESWRDQTGPRVEAAWWLGQHDLASEERSERSPHNLTKELLILEQEYGSARARDVRSTLEARKQEVRDVTRHFGDYLGRAVLGRTVLPEGAWSVRLTPEQVRLLQRALPPMGTGLSVIEVLNEEEARRPGGQVDLRYGDRYIVLPAAAAPARWQGDAAAVGFLFGALTKLYPAVPDMGGARPWAVAIPLMVDTLGAFSYKRGAPTPDPKAAGAADEAGAPLQAALASGLLLTIAAGTTAKTFWKGTFQLYPGGEGLWCFHIILARYYAHLSRRQRAWAVVGSFSIAATAEALRWVRTGERVHAPSAIEATMGALVPFTASVGLGGRLLAQVTSANEVMSQAAASAVDASRAAGMRAEARRLLGWIDEAKALLTATPSIPDHEAAALRSRFEEVREWLTAVS